MAHAAANRNAERRSFPRSAGFAEKSRTGLGAELLLSLSIVMLTSTALIGAMLVRTHEDSIRRLHRLTTRALVEELRSPLSQVETGPADLHWWIVGRDGAVTPRGSHDLEVDAESLALARTVKERGLLRAGAPWEAIRFAAPLGERGDVALAVLPAVVPRGLVLALLFGNVAVFTLLGGYLLRRRLVLPLEKLAEAAHAIRDGASGVRAPVGGSREAAEVGSAFNEMTEALERRSTELEKAVVDLQASNLSLREAREGLDRSERLAAVGRLASGVAHEVGNPMGAMLAFLDLARRDPGLSEESRGYLERAGGEGARVRGILRQLLDFSRPPRPERLALDVAEICEETAELVRAQRRYAGIDFAVVREARAPRCLGDRNLLLQIVLNLLLNAGDALREASSEAPREASSEAPREAGGQAPQVTIAVRPGVQSARRGEDRSRSSERSHFDVVECVVSDNGPGVPVEDRERIFDAFFTTKDPGEGTGLGLANAVRLAAELGGSLSLADADAAEGACFVLRLPVPPEEDRGGSPRVRR